METYWSGRRDSNLGKVMLYQLSYFRMSTLLSEWFAFLFFVAKIR